MERIEEAERLYKKSLPEEPKRKWLKTICPHCGAKVEYSPKADFKGELYCGSCSKPFLLTRLDNFSVRHE